jgi:hypothetical protein
VRQISSLVSATVTLAVAAMLAMSLGPIRATEAADSAFRWVDDPAAGTCDLFLGEQPVLRYMYAADTSSKEKAFATSIAYHHVYGPGTRTVITNGPEGLYPHHKGMFVGWTRATFDGKTENFWFFGNGETQRHVEFVKRTADSDSGLMTARIHWKDREGKLVIEELRTVSARRLATDSPPGYGWSIDWSTILNSRRGRIQLDGDRQHAGFHFRAASPIAEANSARYLRPASFPQQPEAVQVNDRTDPDAHSDLGWLAMMFELNGQRFTVEYHEAADLPKPSRYSERPYGRFGAFFPLTLEEGVPFAMRYLVVVTSGSPPTQQAIQSRHEEFRRATERP